MNEATRRTSEQSVPPVGQRELTAVLLVGSALALLILVPGLLASVLSGSQAWAAALAGIGLLAMSVGFRTTPLDLAVVSRVRRQARVANGPVGHRTPGTVGHARVQGPAAAR